MISPRLNAGQPIAEKDGTMSDAFRTWTLGADLSNPIVGVGSPEGFVEARQFQLYIDTSGVSGSIEYRKMQTSIAGDIKMGWVAI